MKSQRARAIAAATTAICFGGLVNAQTPQTEVPFNWGFASAFGRGLYRLDEGTEAQIYNPEIDPALHKPAEGDDGLTVRLVLPLTFGLQEPIALNHNDVEEYAFMPGVSFEMKTGARFTLRANAQAGAAKQTGADQPSARLAAFGVRSRFEFVNAPGRPALIAGVLWAGVDATTGGRSALVRVTTGLEFNIGTAWHVRGQQMRLMPHVLEDRYYRPRGWLAIGDPPAGDERLMTHEWQVGLAARRDVPFKIGFLKFNAFGVAYRYSDFSPGFRLYLNSVF